MGDKVKLRTTQKAFEEAHVLADAGRRRVTISRTALMDLLLDHSNMAGQLEQAGFKVTDVEDRDPLPVRVRRRPQETQPSEG